MMVRHWQAGCRATTSAREPILLFFFIVQHNVKPDVVDLSLEAYAC